LLRAPYHGRDGTTIHGSARQGTARALDRNPPSDPSGDPVGGGKNAPCCAPSDRSGPAGRRPRIPKPHPAGLLGTRQPAPTTCAPRAGPGRLRSPGPVRLWTPKIAALEQDAGAIEMALGRRQASGQRGAKQRHGDDALGGPGDGCLQGHGWLRGAGTGVGLPSGASAGA
jgi:hypothetical protein